jgi:outer membrane protein assembly factor BamB
MVVSIGVDGMVLVTRYNSSLVALSAKDGTQLWSVPLQATFDAASVGADRTIYCTTYHGLAAVYPTGVIKWELQLPGGPGFGKAIISDGTIVYAGGAYVFNIHPNGTVLWNFFNGVGFLNTVTGAYTPAVGSDGTVFVAVRQRSSMYAFAAVGAPAPGRGQPAASATPLPSCASFASLHPVAIMLLAAALHTLRLKHNI